VKKNLHRTQVVITGHRTIPRKRADIVLAILQVLSTCSAHL